MVHIQFRIAVVGSRGVGKTTFIERHISGKFIREYVATVYPETRLLTFYTSIGKIDLELVEDEASRTDCDATMILFDLTSRATFKESTNRLYLKVCAERPLVLCGNKADVKGRTVSNTQIQSQLSSLGFKVQYYDISAKSNYNFNKPFLCLLQQLLRKPDLYFVDGPCVEPAEVVLKKPIKVVFLGDGGVGKSQVVRKLMNSQSIVPQEIGSNVFPHEFDPRNPEKYVPTLGVEVYPYTSSISGTVYNIWDVAGQEKFGGIRAGYYIDADMAIVFESVFGESSTERWRRDFLRVCPDKPILTIPRYITDKVAAVQAILI